ncbi:MAG: hypothetical protein HN350_06345 [Phycisphaerales bacterium]|jgi:hypothetical protein|nr:hypothetical protein [Phycisphaerales bacterium]
MRKSHIVITLALLASLTTALQAQNKTAQAPVEPVITHIPAGAMGYAIVNNIKKTTETVEAFVNDLGVMPPKPEGAPKTSMFLQMLIQEIKLGDGFNPNGDAAVVMLDINQFGFNVPALIESGTTGKELDAKNKAAIEAGLPVVIYVPGASAATVFSNYKIEKDGDLDVVKLRMGPMFSSQLGGYVLLSPNKAAIKAVKNAVKKTSAELAAKQLTIIKRNNISYHVDLKLLKPIVDGVMDAAGKEAARDEPELAGIIKLYFSLIKHLFTELEAESGGIRIEKAGIIAESIDLAKVSGNIAKAWTAVGKIKPSSTGLLGSLPSLPYVIALGAAGEPGATTDAEFVTKMVDDVLKLEPLATKLSKETKAKTKKTILGLMEQIGEVQIVAGGAPAGNGMFGLAWSIKCKDSAVLKSLIADKAELAQTYLTSLIDDQDVKALKITYSKGVEKSGSVAVDTVEISHPEMLKMSQRERTEMAKVLGEDKIRFMVSAPDKTTVVVTFGGSTAMTSKAIAAAGGKGSIPTAAGTTAAMAIMPKDANVLMFLNIANLLDVIRTGAASMIDDPDQRQMMTAMIPQLQCKTPIAMGAKMKDNTAHSVMFIPTPLIKEIVPKIQQAMMMFMMGAMGGGQPVQPAEPAGDF